MRIFAVLVAFLFGLAVPSHAAPPSKGKPKPQQATAQNILKWINGYRLQKEPEKLAEAVRAMSALGLFKDLDAGGVYVGFIAGVLGDNPAKAEIMVTKMFPIPPEDQVAIIRAIAYSGLPDWKVLLEKFVERMPARLVLIQRYLSGKAPILKDLPLDQSPAGLDINWGYYFATGKTEPVDRIISALEWASDTNNVERLTLGSMAKWTLANNAQQDKELLDHLKVALNKRSKPVAKELREVIEAAETFETSKIRKQAFASIEELKRKGPESTRNMSWWGQAGQTALALGCVVASVLGHAEVGIPCVVGGAVSGAALKLLTPQ